MSARNSDRHIELVALEQARNAFNSYVSERVHPTLGIAKDEEDRLTGVEIALRIPDASMRREYVRRAVAMLQANIRYNTHAATPIPAPERSGVTPIVAALLAAAGGYYASGPALALVLAAAGYWVGYRRETSELAERATTADSHNAEVPEWRKTLADWQESVVELLKLEV